jgi:hypothetical protein
MLTQIVDHMIVSIVWEDLTQLTSFLNAVNNSHLQWCANTGDLKKIPNDKYLITSAYFLQDKLPVKWH